MKKRSTTPSQRERWRRQISAGTVGESRRRDPRALDYGTYWLISIETNAVVAGGQYGELVGLDAVEHWLTSDYEEGTT